MMNAILIFLIILGWIWAMEIIAFVGWLVDNKKNKGKK